jgi:hypothetical protein
LSGSTKLGIRAASIIVKNAGPSGIAPVSETPRRPSVPLTQVWPFNRPN